MPVQNSKGGIASKVGTKDEDKKDKGVSAAHTKAVRAIHENCQKKYRFADTELYVAKCEGGKTIWQTVFEWRESKASNRDLRL